MNTPFGEPVSPELALVDPELAARLRAAMVVADLAPPIDSQVEAVAEAEIEIEIEPAPAPTAEASPPVVRPPAPSAPAAAIPAPPLPDAQPAVGTRHQARRRAGRVGRAVALLGIVALLGAAFARPRDAPTLIDPPETAPASGITLVWQRHPKSRSYVVQIFRKGRLTHAESVRADHLAVPGWLVPGRYTWSVLPGGSSTPLGTGKPIEHGWFIVTR